MTIPPPAGPIGFEARRRFRRLPLAMLSMLSGRRFRRVMLGLAWLLIVVAAVGLAHSGLGLRHWTWDSTSSIRYRADMQNGWFWGSRGANGGVVGFIGLYDQVVAESPHGYYGLDYVPLRLAMMSLWVAHERGQGATRWQNTWEANEPLMWINGTCDAVASIVVGGIVIWGARRRGHGWTVATAGAVAGAALLWLNPAVHVSGFGRPTWDVWILPFYLGACWAMLGRRWMLAGAILGIGAMFKGQQVAVVPFFLAWGILAGGGRAFLSWVAGAGIGVACVVWPWVLTLPPSPPSAERVSAVSLAASPMAAAEASVRIVRWGWVVAIVLTGAVVVWGSAAVRRRLGVARPTEPTAVPDGESPGEARLRQGRWISWRHWSPGPWTVTLTALAIATVFWTASATSGASWAWYEVGFRFGSEKFSELEVGRSSSLAGILRRDYGFRSESLVFEATAWSPEVTLKTLMALGYGAGAIALGVAAGWGQRRGSPTRALIAIPAVWVLFFAVMPLMHERYLLWGAASCAVLTVRHPALMLLGVPLSILSWAMTIFVMLETGNRRGFELFGVNGTDWHRWIGVTYPGAGWGVLLIAGILVWMALFGNDRPTGPASTQLLKAPRAGKPQAAPIHDPGLSTPGEKDVTVDQVV